MNTKSTFREYLQRPACGLSLAALLCLAARPAAAQTWDATADFSLAANPNGAWSYGYAAYDGSAYALMTIPDPNAYDFSGFKAWLQAPGAVPCVAKNTDPVNTYVGWAPGVLGIHPGPAGTAIEHAVVTWTAPANGYYQFTSSFTYVGGGDGAGPSVTKNIRLGPGVYVGIKSGVIDTSAPVMTWNETLILVAGDTISWAINSAGNHGGDSTVLSAEVTSLPTEVFWDANTDFSVAANPNGAWSYEWVNSSTSTGGLMTFAEANFGSQPGLNAWDLGAGSVPCVVKNTSLVNTYYGWAPGKLGMHPNTSSADKAAIRWTAPSNGVYQVHVYAREVGNPGGDGVDVSLYRNLAGSLTGSLWTDNLLTGWETYHDNVYSLTQGESLALVLGNGGAGNNGSDSTTVDFVVTPLPLTSPVLWDARADFSATANANVNGVWSYEWANTSSSTAGLIANMDLNGFGNPGLNTWYVPGSPGLPSVMKNNGGFTYYGLTPGKLGVNPYVASQPWNEAVIRWTAPYDGTFQFAAAWTRVGSWGRSTEDGVNVSVHTNFTGSLSGSLWTGNSFHGVPAQWSGTYTLTKGESLAFVTGNGGVDNFGSDTTAVDIFVASAAATPLPVLSCTPSGNNLTLSWPVDVPGWTLESSTDLDAWDPVPGVVNNSVTVPMTEARQFFRLKQ